MRSISYGVKNGWYLALGMTAKYGEVLQGIGDAVPIGILLRFAGELRINSRGAINTVAPEEAQSWIFGAGGKRRACQHKAQGFQKLTHCYCIRQGIMEWLSMLCELEDMLCSSPP